ncbi:MAG: hypothetical protein V4591_08725 [Bdellovibrionota bacterium]
MLIDDSELNNILNSLLQKLNNKESEGFGESLRSIAGVLQQEEVELIKALCVFYLDTLIEVDSQNSIEILNAIKNTGFEQMVANQLEIKSQCVFYIFGSLYRFGLKVFQIKYDILKAIRLFEKGAHENSVECVRALGIMYDTGEEGLVRVDNSKAEFWYKKGEELNDAVSINNLGLIYLKYLNFENIEKAKLCFEKAVNLGLSQAEENLIAMDIVT